MHRILTAAASLTLLLSSSAMAQNRDFVLENQTGYAITEIYASPVKQSDWGSDMLPDPRLEDTEDIALGFSKRGTTCHYDLLVKFEDDYEAEWSDFNLCEISRITLYYDRRTDETTADVE